MDQIECAGHPTMVMAVPFSTSKGAVPASRPPRPLKVILSFNIVKQAYVPRFAVSSQQGEREFTQLVSALRPRAGAFLHRDCGKHVFLLKYLE